ncbi:GAF domain-containing protein [Lacicoccus alkaliphilus]|uniref:Nitrogen regulatory protein A n=1 Tax=Lacicoccus alkaliphilus DSM 16010 TaxID=1123231 RepID=A0A1M7F3N7_9BACL|nr:GAF domain-containing protein [Salinicoccus alkaliphilus]SHL98600.1 nitrogen regulatory protein A [Salinicoccus alkaliphilus DSM 16010]
MNRTVKDELQELKEKYGFDIGALTEMNNARGTFKWKYVLGSDSQRWKRMELRKGSGLTGVVLKTGKSLVVQDVLKIYSQEELFRLPILYFEKIRGFIAMPIWNNEEAVAGLVVFGDKQPRTISEEEYAAIKVDVEARLRPEFLKEVMLYENT